MNPHKILKHLQSQSDESGLTIIESLVAIIVVSIMLTAIAPVLTLSVANRLQAKQTVAATKAAQGYIDGIRGGTVDHPRDGSKYVMTKDNPEETNALGVSNNLKCEKSNTYCENPKKNLFCVDRDGDNKCTKDSSQDLVVQGFGYIPDTGVRGYRSYKLGVRVYRGDAFALSGKLKTAADTDKKGGMQATFGTFKKRVPLLEMTTEIEVDDSFKFRELCSDAGITSCL